MAFSDPKATVASANPYINGLLWGQHWDDPGSATTTRLAYAIAGIGFNEAFDFGGTSVTARTSNAEVNAFKAALAQISAVCNVEFSQTLTSSADLVFGVVGNGDAHGSLGIAVPPGEDTGPVSAKQGAAIINRDAYSSTNGSSLRIGGYDYITYIHEIGHALGLKHPHDQLGSFPTFAGVPDGASDSTGGNALNQGLYTMMSYNDGFHTGPLGPLNPGTTPAYGWEGTPMAFDIAALQYLYGANTATASGDDFYVLPTLNAAKTFYRCIWDGGGSDMILTLGTASVNIDLNAATLLNAPGGGGFLSSTAGIHGGVTIAAGVVIENAQGGDGADTITGNGAGNKLKGFGGVDIIKGGDGGDIITGGLANDTLSGEDGADIVYGDDGTDTISGGAGDDTLYGGNGDDTSISGDAGADYMFGGAGADTLNGGEGNDRYLGGDAGNDTLIGGLGNDRLEGGADNDVISGQDNDDYALGGDGNDTMTGGAGIDYLYGNAGDDILNSGSQNDNLYGGAGLDSFRFDASAASDVVFDFVNDVDTLSIAGAYGFANAAAVVAATIVSGSHARILLGGGNQIYLWNYLTVGSGNTIANLADDIIIA